MKRRVSFILVLLIILISVSGCSKSKKANMIESATGNGDEIRILISRHNTMNLDNTYEQRLIIARETESYQKCIELARTDFTKKTGNIVKYINIISNNQEEYLQNRNAQLYLEEGPELILISAGEDYQNLINEGVALEIEGKLCNYNNIYSGLQDGYFIPISLGMETVVLNSRAFRGANIPIPDLDWSQTDFHETMMDHYGNLGVRLSPEIMYLIFNSELDNKDIFLNNSGSVQLANEKMVKAIENIRYEIMESKRYRIMPDYKYEDYHAMIYMPHEDWMHNISEGKIQFGELDKDFYKMRQDIFSENPIIYLWGSTNSLNALETHKNKESYISDYSTSTKNNSNVPLDIEDISFLPRPYETYSSWGFIVNRNGRNLEAALEFVDTLLSDEVQLNIYSKIDDKHNTNRNISFSSPVVNTIEEAIDKIHIEEGVSESLVNLRKAVLYEIASGKRVRNYRGNSLRGAYNIGMEKQLREDQERLLKESLEEVIFKIVFADKKYSSEKMMNELRELDNQMNLMFSE